MTGANIDQSLLDAAGICIHEQVQVVNLNHGGRLVSYTISTPAQSRTIELNRIVARLAMPNDRVIIMAYGQFNPEEVQSHRPTIVVVDQHNRIVEAHSNHELN